VLLTACPAHPTPSPWSEWIWVWCTFGIPMACFMSLCGHCDDTSTLYRKLLGTYVVNILIRLITKVNSQNCICSLLFITLVTDTGFLEEPFKWLFREFTSCLLWTPWRVSGVRTNFGWCLFRFCITFCTTLKHAVYGVQVNLDSADIHKPIYHMIHPG
jgi:hypothetical protein